MYANRLTITFWMNSQNKIALSKDSVVEVDESLFSHSDKCQKRVVGLIERVTQKAKTFVVKDRSKETMISLFSNYVEEHAEVKADYALSYGILKKSYKIHQVNKARDRLRKGVETTEHIESL